MSDHAKALRKNASIEIPFSFSFYCLQRHTNLRSTSRFAVRACGCLGSISSTSDQSAHHSHTSSRPQSSPRMTVTPLEHTAIGALGGAVECTLMQPMMAFKNALQEGRPIPVRPVEIYRGLTLNIMSMAPITASQFGTNRAVQQLLLGKPDGELTGMQKFISAAAAGAASGLIASPSELIIIQQQRKGRTLGQETREFFNSYKPTSIYRGLTCTVCREGLYAAGYLGLFPVLQTYFTEKGWSPGTSLVVAGLIGGSFGAAASHPFDTAKTRMQAFMYSKPEYLTMGKTFNTIYQEGGVLRFWRGLLPRMTRIICIGDEIINQRGFSHPWGVTETGATFILNYIRTNTVAFLEDSRKLQPVPISGA